jgi:translation initiation factor eIF-2B subunit delta
MHWFLDLLFLMGSPGPPQRASKAVEVSGNCREPGLSLRLRLIQVQTRFLMATPVPVQNNAAPKVKTAKEMTKAERREVQERQRAAKAQTSGKAAPPKGGNAVTKASKETPAGPSSAPRPPKPVAKPREQVAAKIVQDAVSEGSIRSTRRRTPKSQIFSHFGAPKHTPAAIKGNIHPAIISLGLKFGSFKITGANARCIATMTAFQKVCPIS